MIALTIDVINSPTQSVDIEAGASQEIEVKQDVIIVQSGTELPELSNAGTPPDLMLGKELIDGEGNVVIGAFTLANELSAQENLITQIKSALIGKASDGVDLLAQRMNNEITVHTSDDVITIPANGWRDCKSITSVSYPNATTVNNEAFRGCNSLANVNLPSVTYIGTYAFGACYPIDKIDLPKVEKILNNAFASAHLYTLIIRTPTMCTLANANALNGSRIASGTGYIYVPAALIEEYKANSVWSTYADQFRAIEDYPDICGG